MSQYKFVIRNKDDGLTWERSFTMASNAMAQEYGIRVCKAWVGVSWFSSMLLFNTDTDTMLSEYYPGEPSVEWFHKRHQIKPAKA